ncbi:unnamed protein product [Rhodiola kirilowii]
MVSLFEAFAAMLLHAVDFRSISDANAASSVLVMLKKLSGRLKWLHQKLNMNGKEPFL